MVLLIVWRCNCWDIWKGIKVLGFLFIWNKLFFILIVFKNRNNLLSIIQNFISMAITIFTWISFKYNILFQWAKRSQSQSQLTLYPQASWDLHLLFANSRLPKFLISFLINSATNDFIIFPPNLSASKQILILIYP